MKEFETNGFTFRVKKMNAIELLALQDQINFDNYEASIQTYNTLLEHCEVKIKEQWLQTYKDKNYYPIELEENVSMLKDVIRNMIAYLKEVFQKSNASNTQTE